MLNNNERVNNLNPIFWLDTVVTMFSSRINDFSQVCILEIQEGCRKLQLSVVFVVALAQTDRNNCAKALCAKIHLLKAVTSITQVRSQRFQASLIASKPTHTKFQDILYL